MKTALTAVVAAFAIVACGPASTVQRVYDGRLVEGRYVQAEGYAAFLRGTLAEASGDVDAALLAYGAAVRDDPTSAELWTRLGDLRCRRSAGDTSADRSFSRAVQMDAGYAPAWAAMGRCELARGNLAGAQSAARRAVELDPAADEANVFVARAAPRAQDEAARVILVALSVTARDPLVAWEAIAAWARSRGDVALWVRALGELAQRAPARREAIARSAEELAGAGELAGARAVAAAAVEADDRPLADGPRRLAARLALDEAVVRRDVGAVRRRSTRVRLQTDEAAGRALLAGARSLAVELASPTALADPSARGSRLVIAGAQRGDLRAAAADSRPGDGPASAAAFVAFGVALLRTTTPGSARAALGAILHEPLLGSDDRVLRPAVELAWRGALAPEALPPEGLVELAALRRTPSADPLAAERGVSLDARHACLALALTAPDTARARRLAARLSASAAVDPLIAAASALIQHAAGVPMDASARGALLARDPGDPVLASTALRLADQAGDPDGARAAGDALRAFGPGSDPNAD